ncbi:MAG: hypothetical protein AMXMBFR58_05360 [Phycisphaerae bacterium]
MSSRAGCAKADEDDRRASGKPARGVFLDFAAHSHAVCPHPNIPAERALLTAPGGGRNPGMIDPPENRSPNQSPIRTFHGPLEGGHATCNSNVFPQRTEKKNPRGRPVTAKPL